MATKAQIVKAKFLLYYARPSNRKDMHDAWASARQQTGIKDESHPFTKEAQPEDWDLSLVRALLL